MKRIKLTTLLLVTLTFSLFAGPGLEVGDYAKDFKLKNIDGNMVSMADYADAKGFIVIFSCNHCPFVKKYEDRIVALDKEFKAKGYPVIAINPNDPESYPSDSYDNMIVRAEEKGFTFPYLVDETQKTAQAYGATKTPHVYLLQKEAKDKYKVAYIGAIDDDTEGSKDHKQTFVEDAIQALETGKNPDPNFTKAIGCSIKWKK